MNAEATTTETKAAPTKQPLASLCILENIFIDPLETIRLTVPSINGSGAFWLEAKSDLTYDQIRDLLPKMAEALKNVQIVEE